MVVEINNNFTILIVIYSFLLVTTLQVPLISILTLDLSELGYVVVVFFITVKNVGYEIIIFCLLIVHVSG